MYALSIVINGDTFYAQMNEQNKKKWIFLRCARVKQGAPKNLFNFDVFNLIL